MSDFPLYDIAKRSIEIGLSLGADQIESYVIYGSLRSVQLEKGSIHHFTDTSSSGIGVRVIKDKSIGMSSTTVFSSDSIEETVKNAYSLAKVSPPDPNFSSLPLDKRESPKIKDLYDQEIVDLSVEDFSEMVQETIQEAKVREDAVIGGRFTAGYGKRLILNSLGVERETSQTSVGGYIQVKVLDGDDIGNSYYGDTATQMKKLDHIEIGMLAGERSLKMLGSKKIKTTNLPVLLDPESAYGTISPIIGTGIDAFNVFNKTAFFVDKVGDRIATDKLTIVDDPFYEGGTDSAGFDDEGVVPKKLTIVKNGILQTFITDSYSAPLVGMENTGHASRASFASRPTPSLYALQIKNGETSKDEMLSDLKEGILLIDSSIAGMGDNPQVSAQINQGFYVKNGEIQYPVKNTVIGTTVFEILENLEMLSKEIEDRNGHIAPWMKLAPMRISGGK